jgi:predicted Zn finger-like uncharacterized protein
MSLATRCPSCGTIFRVVQDQLKVSEGWVRCGQCHEVFHGIEALFDLDSDPAIAARRAAARAPAAPPPTRVFAEQRANAPIPVPTQTQTPQAPSPIAIPARPSAPVATGRQSVPATPSAFGPSGLPPVAPGLRPGYTGFTPAARTIESPPAPSPPPPPLAPSPIAPRGTIAPRFAARLAEEAAARSQAPAPSAHAPTPHVSLADPPAPVIETPPAREPQPEWRETSEPGSGPMTSSPAEFAVPASVAESIAAPTTAPAVPAFAPAPGATTTAASPSPAITPEPARAETPLVTAIDVPPPVVVAPSAAELAAAFAAPAAGASEPASAPVAAPEPAPVAAADIGGSTMPSLLAQDAADADDDARAGPPTLASMLPEDAGDWPPRRTKKRADNAVATSTEVALVDRTRDPRFLREARSGARWRKPWVRAVLSVALALLVVAAAGQVAWPLRDTIASRWPVTVPAWDWICAQAGCRIEAPRAIASLALDGSSLTRTDTDHVLLFSADLHNRADHDVRMPSFDVTFMDLNGEIVARKVLAPEQLGIHQAALPADGELHVHARLQVGTLPATGFQADLFYP